MSFLHTVWDTPSASFLFSVILWLTYFRIVYSNLLSTLKNEFGNLDLYNFYWKMEDISSVNVAFLRMYLFAHFQVLRGSLYKRCLQTFLSIGTYTCLVHHSRIRLFFQEIKVFETVSFLQKIIF